MKLLAILNHNYQRRTHAMPYKILICTQHTAAGELSNMKPINWQQHSTAPNTFFFLSPTEFQLYIPHANLNNAQVQVINTSHKYNFYWHGEQTVVSHS